LLTALPISDDEELYDLILNRMQDHINCHKVQEGCMRWLLYNHRIINIERCIETVLQAMSIHRNAHLQGRAIELLSICNCQAVLKHGCVDAVLRALSSHKTSFLVQQAAARFLTALSFATIDAPATAAFGGGPAVLDTIWKGLGIVENDDLAEDEQSVDERGDDNEELGVEDSTDDDDGSDKDS
jgi:hypothetical protein